MEIDLHLDNVKLVSSGKIEDVLPTSRIALSPDGRVMAIGELYESFDHKRALHL